MVLTWLPPWYILPPTYKLPDVITTLAVAVTNLLLATTKVADAEPGSTVLVLFQVNLASLLTRTSAKPLPKSVLIRAYTSHAVSVETVLTLLSFTPATASLKPWLK